jgi:hypothetical protein
MNLAAARSSNSTVSRTLLLAWLVAACAPAQRVAAPPSPPPMASSAVATPAMPSAPTTAAAPAPTPVASLWDAELGPPLRTTPLVTTPALKLPLTWPLRPAAPNRAERARLIRELARAFPPDGPGADPIWIDGTISITDRRWPTGAVLPSTGPWHELATAPALAAEPTAAAMVQAVYGGRALWGSPTLAALRRVEPDPSGAMRFCGFPGAVPRCVLVTNGLVETTPDDGAVWRFARDPARLDRLRAAVGPRAHTLARHRRALVWQEAHGTGCESYPHVACDPIVVEAGLQPVGDASTRREARTVTPAELEAKPYLLIQCQPHEVLSVVAVVQVAAEQTRRGPAPEAPADAHLGVEETVEVIDEAPAVYDAVTGARLGTLPALQQRGAVLWPFGDDHDAIQIRGALSGTYCGA